MKKIFGYLLFLFIATACEEIYTIPPQSQVQINFYALDEESQTISSKSTLLSIKGLNNDSVWTAATTTSSFVLPLGNSGSDTLVMMMDSLQDLLIINYSPILQYESMDSGFYYEYIIHSVMHSNNKIDAIQLSDSLVIDDAHENLQIIINDNTGYTTADTE